MIHRTIYASHVTTRAFLFIIITISIFAAGEAFSGPLSPTLLLDAKTETINGKANPNVTTNSPITSVTWTGPSSTSGTATGVLFKGATMWEAFVITYSGENVFTFTTTDEAGKQASDTVTFTVN